MRVEFELLKKGFAVVFYRPDEQLNTTEKMSDVGLNVGLNVEKDVGLKRADQVLDLIKGDNAITAEEMAAIFKSSSTQGAAT